MENYDDPMDAKMNSLFFKNEDEGQMAVMELEVNIEGPVTEEREALEISHMKTYPNEDINSPEGNKKVCGVCNREAKRTHFGTLCCDSCRAFFRRSVQNNAWETFICFKEGHCDISENRRSCQSCRFNRCRDKGMDMSLVMTEEDRKALMVRKLEKRRQIISEYKRHENTNNGIHSETAHLTTEQNFSEDDNRPIVSDLRQSRMTYLSEEDIANKCKIENLQKLLRMCLSFPDFPASCDEVKPDVIEKLFIIFCKNLGRFFGSIPEFQSLDPAYQRLLLKPGVAKAMFIIGTHQFETSRNCWPRVPLTSSCSFPTISMTAMENFIDDNTTMWKWKDYIQKYSLFHRDEVVTLLTVIISLFDHKDLNMVEISDISIRKTRYIQLFKFFLQKQYGQTAHAMSCLWDSLVDIEELRECFENSTTKEEHTTLNSGIPQSYCKFSRKDNWK